jgi:hypothetical protein
MGANISPTKFRSLVLATPLRDYTNCTLLVDCFGLNCARGRLVAISTLPSVDGEATIGQALRKLKCSACGKGVRHAALRCPRERGGKSKWIVTPLTGTVQQHRRPDR